MRALGIMALAIMLTFGFLVAESPAANAFGTEVLGCAFDNFDNAAWTANSCAGGGDGYPHPVYFWAHNLSGTYTSGWTVTREDGTALPDCSSLIRFNCIMDCATLTACEIYVRRSGIYTAKLRLTQSGQTRTISAKAVAG